jgi:D-alanine--D-alanine ligase
MIKIRVGVLIGGPSIEKEVSLNSGRTICDHIDSAKYDIIPLFWTQSRELYILPWRFMHRGKISDFEHRLATEAPRISWDSLKQRIDIVYIALHGRYGEDGCIQGLLEIFKIPYCGSKVFASALGMDKHIQKQALNAAGITTAHGIFIHKNHVPYYSEHANELESLLTKNNVQFPIIVKPHHEGSSLGISCVNTLQDLPKALYNASNVSDIPQGVLIEERVMGMEFTCVVITDYKNNTFIPLPPTEVVAENVIYEYDQKYMPGRATKYTPARCSTEQMVLIQDAAVRTMQALEFTNTGRIDGFITPNNEVVITDPNSFSGMSPSSFAFLQAAHINMSHTGLINHLLETELHAHHMLVNDTTTHHEDNNTKIRVGVLLGGRSNEREISLESGRNIYYKLSPHKYDAHAYFLSTSMELFELDQTLLVRNSTKEIESALLHAHKIEWSSLPSLVDFVFIALHGGEGENGCVQGMLEALGLPYNGSSVLASALCMDKYKTAEYLSNVGFDVPHHILIEKNSWSPENTSSLITHIKGPWIVKPHDDGCSVMVHKAHTLDEVNEAIHEIFSRNKTHALVEEFVAGMELTVGVIGNENPQALPPSYARASQGILSIEEKFLPGAGENQTPAPISQEAQAFVQDTIARTFAALGCQGYARIDCFYQTAEQSPTNKERLVILEVNTLPGMTPATCIFHQAAELGIKPMDFIDIIVQLGFEAHGKNQKLEIFEKLGEMEKKVQAQIL